MMQNINDMYDKNGISFDSDRHMISRFLCRSALQKRENCKKERSPEL